MSLAQLKQQSRDIEDLRTTVFGDGSKGSGLKSMCESHDMMLVQISKNADENKRMLRVIFGALIIGAISFICGIAWNGIKANATNELVLKAVKEINAAAEKVESSVP